MDFFVVNVYFIAVATVNNLGGPGGTGGGRGALRLLRPAAWVRSLHHFMHVRAVVSVHAAHQSADLHGALQHFPRIGAHDRAVRDVPD